MQKFISAPHRGDTPGVPTGSPNAALLIDFDNVTMGIRSDLTTQLKDLLNSDIIRGKVAVQRAYADWRRYAQYIVPLSEASVDLIFAPAYGSSKKNATDIRLAIDALELVFTRPEIGVYILLSGDSDFSSLVLKLKEYGKYVIGVGLRESASDLLVQNCDEYFSYSSLTGLTKAGEEDVVSQHDPWDLVEKAVQQMADENDVMRSDRLKQVMLDLDPNFDEGEIGYSKFNKFLVEAASRNRLALRKLDNGQYEVQPFEDGADAEPKEDRRRGRGGRRGREASQARTEPKREARRQPPKPPAPKPTPAPQTRERKAEDLRAGYDLLQRAIRELIEKPGDGARDSDIKRQILDIQPGWDESELGFTKFSRFLRQAHDAEVIDLQRTGEGYYLAHLPRGSGPAPKAEQRGRGRGRDERRTQATPAAPESRAEPAERREERERREDAAALATEAPAERSRPAAPTATEPATAGRTAERSERSERPEPEQPEQPEPPEPPEAGGEAAPEAPEVEEPESKATDAGGEEPEAGEAEAAPKKPAYGRRGRRGTRADGPPPLLPGQVVGASEGGVAPDAGAASEPEEAEPEVAEPEEAERVAAEREEPAASAAPPAGPSPRSGAEPPEADADEAGPPEEAPGAPEFDADELGLPTDEGSVIRYLSNSYQGVGQKTAEALIEAFGADRVFNGLNSRPEQVREVLGSGRRTEALLEAWQRDYRRRTSAGAAEKQPVAD